METIEEAIRQLEDLSARMAPTEVTITDLDIANGGNCTVHRAIWRGEVVACKEPFFLKHPRTFGLREAEDVRRLYDSDGELSYAVRELKLHADLCQDPESASHIVQLRSVVVDHVYGVPVPKYAVLEYVSGGTLAGQLKGRGDHGLEPERIYCFARDVAVALAFLHAKGMIHRDIKPDNILVRRAGQVERAILADFGYIKKMQDGKSSLSIKGAPNYVAPEYADDVSKLSPKCDMYSYGITVVELCGLDSKQLDVLGREEFLGLARCRARRVPLIQTYITSCLHKDPDCRPAAEDFPTEAVQVYQDALRRAALAEERLHEVERVLAEVRARAEDLDVAQDRVPAEQQASCLHPGSPFPVTYYTIVAKCSGGCLAVSAGSREEKALITFGPVTGEDHQLFRFERSKDGRHFSIIAKHSNKCVDIALAKQSDGAQVMQWHRHAGMGHYCQRFRLEASGDGTHFYIVAKHSDKCLEAAVVEGAELESLSRHPDISDLGYLGIPPRSTSEGGRGGKVSIVQMAVRAADNSGQLFRLEAPCLRLRAPLRVRYYRVIAKQGGKCMHVPDSDDKDGCNIVQEELQPYQDNQLFRLEESGDGRHIFIIARHSNKCLDVRRALEEPKAPVKQFEVQRGLDNASQLFRVEPSGDGEHFFLAAKSTGQRLAAALGAGSWGGAVQVSEPSDDDGQLFRFEATV